jgi:tRNA U38,U39,U40 pseudouridine synthase TruA
VSLVVFVGLQEFDMSRYHQRYIALKLAYLGWQYDGLAVQNDTDNTIEVPLQQFVRVSVCVRGVSVKFTRGLICRGDTDRHT